MRTTHIHINEVQYLDKGKNVFDIGERSRIRGRLLAHLGTAQMFLSNEDDNVVPIVTPGGGQFDVTAHGFTTLTIVCKSPCAISIAQGVLREAEETVAGPSKVAPYVDNFTARHDPQIAALLRRQTQLEQQLARTQGIQAKRKELTYDEFDSPHMQDDDDSRVTDDGDDTPSTPSLGGEAPQESSVPPENSRGDAEPETPESPVQTGGQQNDE